MLLSAVDCGHRPGSGRSLSKDACQDQRIVRAAEAAQTATREEIWEYVTLTVSPRTIRNYLLAAKLRSYVPLARLPLTPRHGQAQLLWCRERVDWRVERRSVVFSDESRFCLYGSYGHAQVRRRPGERHLPECIRPRHRGPISDFMV